MQAVKWTSWKMWDALYVMGTVIDVQSLERPVSVADSRGFDGGVLGVRWDELEVVAGNSIRVRVAVVKSRLSVFFSASVSVRRWRMWTLNAHVPDVDAC
jgi:hypothetical protein